METAGFSPYQASKMFQVKQEDVRKRLKSVYFAAVDRDFCYTDYPFKKHDVVLEIYLIADRLSRHPQHGNRFDHTLRKVAESLASGVNQRSWYNQHLIPLTQLDFNKSNEARFANEHINWLIVQFHYLTGYPFAANKLLKDLNPDKNFLFPERYNLLRFYRP
jgi:hypothetical protein